MRKRNPENTGLPKRWRLYHGAYYYQVPAGQEYLWDGKKQFRLGKTLSEAYSEFGSRIANYSDVATMEQLFDRYFSSVMINKAPATQRSNQISLRRLRRFFADNRIHLIRPKHIYKFRDLCTEKHGAVSANRDLEVLSHSFTKAIEWGAIDSHPMAGKKVVKNPSQKRTRYIEDWELKAFLTIASPFLQSYIEVKLVLGLRKGDMLSIRLSDISAEGVSVLPRKTRSTRARKIVFTWTENLRKAVAAAREVRPSSTSEYLFCTRDGHSYIKDDGSTSGFDSIWQRAMSRALAQTKLKLKFTEHDLRAKVASDIDLSHARQLMGHSNESITDRVYRRKAELVTPAR